MRFWLALTAVASLCSLAAFEGVPIGIPELTRRAELVVRGKVIEKSVSRNRAGQIYTEIKLTVTESWKGNLKTSPLKVTQPGGTLGEQRDFAVDDAKYEIGEDVVLFLMVDSRGGTAPVDSASGKFNILRGEATNLNEKVPLNEMRELVRKAIR